jgi:zinc protease
MNKATNAFPGPDDITRVCLKNGITILARPNPNSPSVYVNGYLDVGSLFDPDEKLGLANFTASALMRGTTKRNFQQIYDALEGTGASLGFGGGTHTTGFTGKALSEDFDLLLGLISEALREPTFPPEHIERIRAMLLTGLSIRAQDTEEMASLKLDQIIYKDHPYRRPEDGYVETIKRIMQEDIVQFHRQHFGPKGMVIAIVGAIQPEKIIEKINKILGDWYNPLQPNPIQLPEVNRLDRQTKERVSIPGKSQAEILIAAPGPKRQSTEFMAAALGNNILGQFGMFGRIGEAVREKAGLAYYAYSSLNGGVGPGPWSVSAGVDPSNVDKAINLIIRELERFTNEPVSETELEDSQSNFIGRLPLSLESNPGVAGALINLEKYNLGLDYYLRYPELIRSISRIDVLKAAQKFLNQKWMGIVIAGTFQDENDT